MSSIHNMSSAVNTCCILHNICMEKDENLDLTEVTDMPQEPMDLQPDVPSHNEDGIAKRNAIAASL